MKIVKEARYEFMRGSMKQIGILTGGDDAPGLNAVIRAAVKTANNVYGWKVLGIKNGFEGLLNPGGVISLTPEMVRGILPRGGYDSGRRKSWQPVCTPADARWRRSDRR